MTAAQAPLAAARGALVLLLPLLASLALLASPAPSRAATTRVDGTRPVEIDAPSALKDLLVGNLDLARAARLTGDAALDDSEWGRLIGAAPAQARELVATEGFFDATITVEPVDDAARTIRLHVVPGPQADVDRVTLQFDGDLDRAASDGDAAARRAEADLQRAWAMPVGTPFRNAKWSDAKAQWLALLRARGYGAATFSGTSATVDPQTHGVRLFLVADSGPQFRAGTIVVDGLERQSEATVRHLAGFGAGAPLEETRLLDWQDRLQKTGLFDQVAVTYDPDPATADHATVTVHVHEQRLQQATVAVGVSTNTGPRTELSYTHRLPFGQPVTSASKLVWGRDQRSFSSDLVTHPDDQFHSWLLGVAADRLTTRPVDASEDTVESGHVRFGRTRDTTQFERLVFAQVERAKDCAAPGCIDARAATLNQNNVWRRVDSVILPTDGWTLSTQAAVGLTRGEDSGLALPRKTSPSPFARLYARATAYQPLPGKWYASERLEVGQVLVKDDVEVPDPELFRAGGDDSVRGYPYRSLAPTRTYDCDPLTTDCTGYTRVVGGKSLVTASVEIAHPISDNLPSVWWAAFVDVGAAAPRFNDLQAAAGPGLGIRWRSPVGPLRIDWAWGEKLHRGRLSLSLGIAF